MEADVLLGLQWGDEGKGKAVDVLAPSYHWIARFQGGPNAGHTLWMDGQKIVLHTIPSGIFREDCMNLIGNGVVIHPPSLLQEIKALRQHGLHLEGKLMISAKTHLILPGHRLLDQAFESAKGDHKIGSTLRGIGPAYTDKYARHGLRYCDLAGPQGNALLETAHEEHLRQLKALDFELPKDLPEQVQAWMDAVYELLRDFAPADGSWLLNQALDQGQRVLAEGAQGSLLDVEFGAYPFVTSSHTTSASACTGLGIAPNRLGTVYGLFKAYCTRVGSGPFPTELHDQTGEALRRAGHEFGATTGRPRRCGWLDLPALAYAIRLSGVSQLIITKADVLSGFEEIKIATHYQGLDNHQSPYPNDSIECIPEYKTFQGWNLEASQSYGSRQQLPTQLQTYLSYLEDQLNLPIRWISLGPERNQILECK
ncbi:MAG: adenylosuccinate synthase [Bacteroidetes bacterium]|nr:adenylosuccinate synthase [Bacteroidota bacterium]